MTKPRFISFTLPMGGSRTITALSPLSYSLFSVAADRKRIPYKVLSEAEARVELQAQGGVGAGVYLKPLRSPQIANERHSKARSQTLPVIEAIGAMLIEQPFALDC
jgi:hypothetical protein